MSETESYKAVRDALKIGYRHIDSAAWYYNEAECGKAIRDFVQETASVTRSDIFFTTKLQQNAGKVASLKSIDISLQKCGLDYIDLYLIHGPLGGPDMRKQSWEACLEAQVAGKIRSIGVSNYGVKHIEEMLASGKPLPAVNQIELHPFNAHADIVEICRKHNIVLQAWAPLVRAMKMDHPTVQAVAKAHVKTAGQVLLRYSLQKGFVPLPKSVKRERILSNSEIFDFELSIQEMKAFDALDEALSTDWEVTTCP